MAALIRLQKHLISFNSFTIKAPCHDVIFEVLLWSHALWKYLLCLRQQWETFISVDLTVQVSFTNSGKESQDVSVVWTAELIIGRFNGLMSVSGGSWWDGSAIIAFAQTRHTKGWRLQMSGHLITKSRPRVFIELAIRRRRRPGEPRQTLCFLIWVKNKNLLWWLTCRVFSVH